MKVLVACEYSGIVRNAFAARGHQATSCDLLPYEINLFEEPKGDHYQGNILNIINDGWDIMIAHPPCTYLSNAGARHLYPKGKLNNNRLQLALGAKTLFMSLINAPIEKICIENPLPVTVVGLPKYDQIVHPYYFGDDYQKRTCLWLKNLQLLTYTKPDKPQKSTRNSSWFNKGGTGRAKNRAKTFPGMAKAMAEQWG